MNWLESIFYGLISGFAEFLPVSSDGQAALYLKLIGGADDAAMHLAVHIGILLAVFISCSAFISKLNRERRIAAIPKKRRKRQPDVKTMLDIRLLKAVAIPMVIISAVARYFLGKWSIPFWFISIMLFVNGVILFVPQFYPGANKDSRTLSHWDAFLMALASALGAVPGISRLGGFLSAAQLRGAERRYALDIGLLLTIPAVAVLIVFDFVLIFSGTVSGFSVINFIAAALFSFGGGYAAISFIRFLTVKSDFSGFAYYSWGAALLSLIVYLVS